MNAGAIELYADHGINLCSQYLEIAVCAQHCNGGVAVDEHWQSDVKGLYVAGEAAGTFGVYRPGGSALNSTQVGSLRAAEHISKKPYKEKSEARFDLPKISYGVSNLRELREKYQREMSRVADFDRSTEGMKRLFDEVDQLCKSFFGIASISDSSEIAELYKLYDMALTQRAVLSAMICSAENIGTHGSAFVDNMPGQCGGEMRKTRTITKKGVSVIEPVSEMPTPELWFETLLARKKKEMDDEKRRI